MFLILGIGIWFLNPWFGVKFLSCAYSACCSTSLQTLSRCTLMCAVHSRLQSDPHFGLGKDKINKLLCGKKKLQHSCHVKSPTAIKYILERIQVLYKFKQPLWNSGPNPIHAFYSMQAHQQRLCYMLWWSGLALGWWCLIPILLSKFFYELNANTHPSLFWVMLLCFFFFYLGKVFLACFFFFK